MHDFAIELGPVRRIRNSSHCFNGTDHGADGGYWTRRWMWSALNRVGGIFCFRCAFFYKVILGKREGRVEIQGGEVCGSIGGIGHHDLKP